MESKILEKTVNAGLEEKMTSSFSTSAGIFCLAWKVKDKICSVWGKNREGLVQLFFTVQKKDCPEVWYFPPGHEPIRILKRRVRDELLDSHSNSSAQVKAFV